MNLVKLFCAITLLAFLSLPLPARAIIIDVQATWVTGNTWELNIEYKNNNLGSPIEGITSWFDFSLFENLNLVSTPSGWDPLAIQPDPTIPDDGFYDLFALSGGIAPGASQDGFVISVDWLGGDAIYTQLVEVYDPNTFQTIESGQAMIDFSGAGTTVPEPPLILVTLLASWAVIRRQSWCSHR